MSVLLLLNFLLFQLIHHRQVQDFANLVAQIILSLLVVAELGACPSLLVWMIELSCLVEGLFQIFKFQLLIRKFDLLVQVRGILRFEQL